MWPYGRHSWHKILLSMPKGQLSPLGVPSTNHVPGYSDDTPDRIQPPSRSATSFTSGHGLRGTRHALRRTGLSE